MALPKTYHQLAVVRGTEWAIIGSSVARAPRRWSNQLAIAEMRRIVILAFIRVRRASESVRPGPELAIADLIVILVQATGGGPEACEPSHSGHPAMAGAHEQP